MRRLKFFLPWMIGDEMSASWSWEPRGTLTRWEPVPSLPFNALIKAVNKSLFAWQSPKLTMSQLTFSFFKRLASFTISPSSATNGDPMNKTIRILWFFPWRCFNTSWKIKTHYRVWSIRRTLSSLTWAILIPVTRLTIPFGWTRCIFDMIRPTSPVSVANTSTVLEDKNRKYIWMTLNFFVFVSYLDNVSNPTLFSGFERSFVRQTRLMPSFWALSRVGR